MQACECVCVQRPSLTSGDWQQEEGQGVAQEEDEEEEESDYINASELQSPAGETPAWRYIAAQVSDTPALGSGPASGAASTDSLHPHTGQTACPNGRTLHACTLCRALNLQLP